MPATSPITIRGECERHVTDPCLHCYVRNTVAGPEVGRREGRGRPGGQAPGRSDFGSTTYDGLRRRARSFRRNLELHVNPGIRPRPGTPHGAVPPGALNSFSPCHAESPVLSVSLDPPGTTNEWVGVSGDGEDANLATSAAR